MWPYLRKRPLTETTVEPFSIGNAFSNVENAFWKRCQRVLERWQCISTKQNIHWKPFQNRCRTFGMRFETLITHCNESENPLKTISKSLHEQTNSDAFFKSFENFLYFTTFWICRALNRSHCQKRFQFPNNGLVQGILRRWNYSAAYVVPSCVVNTLHVKDRTAPYLIFVTYIIAAKNVVSSII